LEYKKVLEMKKIISKILAISAFAFIMLMPGACTKDLLDQQPTTELGSASFWRTEADATTALMGAYADIRPFSTAIIISMVMANLSGPAVPAQPTVTFSGVMPIMVEITTQVAMAQVSINTIVISMAV
jgi:hypothetical protein